MARDYELGVVINPDVGDEQARAIVERITQTVQANNGQVVRVNAWGRRRLAYPIEHHRDGLYFFFDLVLDPTSVAEIERSLRVNEAIIRHLMKLRDARVVAQERQREAEAEVRAADARAAAEAEAQTPAMTEAPAAVEAEAEATAAPEAPETEAAPEPVATAGKTEAES